MPRSDPLPVADEEAASWCICDDDPVHRPVGAGRGQGPAQPRGLRSPAVAADVERGARRDGRVAGAGRRGERGRAGHQRAGVLVHDVVGVEGDEQGRSHLERVPVAPEPGSRCPGAGSGSGRRCSPAGRCRTRSRGCRGRASRAGRLRRPGCCSRSPATPRAERRVQVRVAQVPVEQVEQGLERLDRLDRVGALPVRQHPLRVRRGQVPEAGEPEGHPARGRGAHRPGTGAAPLRRLSAVTTYE